jgi:hypothetical protein
MDSFAEEAEKHELLEIQIGIIYPQKTRHKMPKSLPVFGT